MKPAEKEPQQVVLATEQNMPAPVNEASAVISMIERVALNPDVDIDRLERLLDMQERIVARTAKNAFLDAMSAMQQELPVVDENGVIKHADKDRPNAAPTVIGTYAYWEDINEAVLPVLAKHGFSLTFRVARDHDQVCVTGILGHRAGHSEETTLPLPHDASGKKNSVQAIGSSISYGKRYTATMLLNLTSRNDPNDDDGESAVNNKSSSQAKEDGDWQTIENEFADCNTVPDLIVKKDQWKAKVPKGWLGSLQDKYIEHFNRIKFAPFEPVR